MTTILVGLICLIVGYTIGALHGFHRARVNALYQFAKRAGQVPDGMGMREWIEKELKEIRE